MIEYIAAWIVTHIPRARDERGLSQSTENALLVVGVVAVVGTLITLVTLFIKAKLDVGLK
ncbi:MAG: hypothetical protein KBG85_00100 [Micropruina sp.]|jgi:hypothetical protein|nr:hypothetical protein [Micropruina sp.]